MNFWKQLPHPFLALAPMEEVTDTVFRRMVIDFGRPDVMFSEFTNVDGLVSPGKQKVGERLVYTPEERPLAAQLWGAKPENFFKAAQDVAARGFDGIDINFGCPDRAVVNQGGGGAIIGNLKLAGEIIEAVKAGGKLPVSVKTRLGKKAPETEEWIGGLLEYDLDAITIHGRTVKELSLVPNNWEEIGKAVKLRNNSRKGQQTLILGNGDVKNREEAEEKAKTWEVDGVMIGRAIFENPALFAKKKTRLSNKEKILAYQKHIRWWREQWGETKNYAILKKFMKTYIRDMPEAAELREKIAATTSLEGLEKVVLMMD